MEVETEQVGEPRVVAHDELHLGGGGLLVCNLILISDSWVCNLI